MDLMEIQEELDKLFWWIDDHSLLSMDKSEYYKMTKEILDRLGNLVEKLEGQSMHEFYTITDGELFIHKNFKYTFTENIIEAIKFDTLNKAQWYIKKFNHNFENDIDFKIIKVTCTLEEVGAQIMEKERYIIMKCLTTEQRDCLRRFNEIEKNLIELKLDTKELTDEQRKELKPINDEIQKYVEWFW